MNILITGAKGFVGRNLSENLKNIRDGKNRTWSEVAIDEIFECDIDTDEALLDDYISRAGFVFHLAGVNRPKDNSEFMAGNRGFSDKILEKIKACKRPVRVMLASSIQASLEGRYAESDYGKSKRCAEEAFFAYQEETGAEAYVYRFPNLFGKWCRPNYNSVVATFANNIANDLPITISDRSQMLTLAYIDDVVEEMLSALCGKPHRCDVRGSENIENQNGKYCFVPVTHAVTLGEMADLLYMFHGYASSLTMPELPEGSFQKKLYSTYLSYLPESRVKFPLPMNTDPRGSFTEIMRTATHGQFSVNISNPGITKGQHWHNTKWEFFIVVSGRALIQQRRIGDERITEFEVSGDKIECVHMLPGYTHNIINLSDTEKLVTVMWANERFDPERPDTYFEKV